MALLIKWHDKHGNVYPKAYLRIVGLHHERESNRHAADLAIWANAAVVDQFEPVARISRTFNQGTPPVEGDPLGGLEPDYSVGRRVFGLTGEPVAVIAEAYRALKQQAEFLGARDA